MNYDKDSFMRGLMVGLKLPRRFPTWEADEIYTRRAAGRLGEVALVGEGLTLEHDIPYTAEAGVSVSGNTITMTGGGRFAVDSGFFAMGDEVTVRLTVSALWQLLPATLNGYGAWPADVEASGNWYLHHMGAADSGWDVPECASLGSGGIRFVKDYPTQTLALRPTDAGGGTSAAAFATVRIDSLGIGNRCYKLHPGYCVAVYVRYLDAEGVSRLTPCLISDVASDTLCAATPTGEADLANVSDHLFQGMRFCMFAEQAPMEDQLRKMEGVPLLDFTGAAPITDRETLFTTVAEAVNLRVLEGG